MKHIISIFCFVGILSCEAFADKSDIDKAFELHDAPSKKSTSVSGDVSEKLRSSTSEVGDRYQSIERARAEEMRRAAASAEPSKSISASSSSWEKKGVPSVSGGSAKKENGDGIRTFSCLIHCKEGIDIRVSVSAKDKKSAADLIGGSANGHCMSRKHVLATSIQYGVHQCSEQ